MEKGKVIPMILAAILLIVAIIIFVYNQSKDVSFDKLIVTYNGHKNEYDTLTVDDVIVVGNVSFWVVSTIKDSIVLNTSASVFIDNKEVTEIEVNLNERKNVCFKENDCIFLELV